MKLFKTALLVEDDPIAVFVQKKIVEKEKVADRIIVKNSSESALEFIHKEITEGRDCPELILLDILLTGETGFDFIEELIQASLFDKTHIIIVTNSFLLKDQETIQKLNVRHYIEKPLTTLNLKETLARIKEHVNSVSNST